MAFATYTIVCDDPLHLSRSGEPGWTEMQGYLEVPDDVPVLPVPGSFVRSVSERLAGYRCQACASHIVEEG
jgi:hypothetical protein